MRFKLDSRAQSTRGNQVDGRKGGTSLLRRLGSGLAKHTIGTASWKQKRVEQRQLGELRQQAIRRLSTEDGDFAAQQHTRQALADALADAKSANTSAGGWRGLGASNLAMAGGQMGQGNIPMATMDFGAAAMDNAVANGRRDSGFREVKQRVPDLRATNLKSAISELAGRIEAIDRELEPRIAAQMTAIDPVVAGYARR